jgi:hypothetical protein
MRLCQEGRPINSFNLEGYRLVAKHSRTQWVPCLIPRGYSGRRLNLITHLCSAMVLYVWNYMFHFEKPVKNLLFNLWINFVGLSFR